MKSENIQRLEQFWYKSILDQRVAWKKDLDGAIIAYYPTVPIYIFNHVANINVTANEVSSLIKKATEFFISKEIQSLCFRVSPLTFPKSIARNLENQGFKMNAEQSVMIYKGEQVKIRPNPNITIKEIKESNISLFCKLFFIIFEIPKEWQEGFKNLMIQRIRKRIIFYIAYFNGKAVGICYISSSMKIGGIFAIGTLKEYRGKGIGTALTEHAVLRSINEGNDLHTLQSEKGEYAERLYKKIGFEIDHNITFFSKKIS